MIRSADWHARGRQDEINRCHGLQAPDAKADPAAARAYADGVRAARAAARRKARRP